MTLRLNGSTSGYTEIDAPAVAGSNTLVLPSGNGSANQLLKNGSTAGTLGWSSMVETPTGVGIGSGSPVRALHVAGSGSCEVVLEQTNGKADNRKYNLLVDGGSSTVTPNFVVRILNDAGSAETVTAFRYDGTTGNFAFNSGYGSVATAYGCRAWVNYNGGGASIRASGNVSSVTKNGGGDYTINFANAMPDANYCVSTITLGNDTAGTQAQCLIHGSNSGGATTMTASALRVMTGSTSSNSVFDKAIVSVAVFR
jgi:hypothetical protein